MPFVYITDVDASQRRLLYVFDPSALQSIIIKDQQYYEESSFSLTYEFHARRFGRMLSH